MGLDPCQRCASICGWMCSSVRCWKVGGAYLSVLRSIEYWVRAAMEQHGDGYTAEDGLVKQLENKLNNRDVFVINMVCDSQAWQCMLTISIRSSLDEWSFLLGVTERHHSRCVPSLRQRIQPRRAPAFSGSSVPRWREPHTSDKPKRTSRMDLGLQPETSS